MVGHSGKVDATVKAIEVVDSCIGRVLEAVRAQRGVLLITADHGNAEQLIDPEKAAPTRSTQQTPCLSSWSLTMPHPFATRSCVRVVAYATSALRCLT